MSIKKLTFGEVLQRMPEKAKRPLAQVFESIVPNNFDSDPHRARKIQQGLLRAVDAALEKYAQATVKTPAPISLGGLLLQVSTNIEAVLLKPKNVREIRHEVKTLAFCILAAERKSDKSADTFINASDRDIQDDTGEVP